KSLRHTQSHRQTRRRTDPVRLLCRPLEERIVPDAITVAAPTSTALPQWWVDTDTTGNGPMTFGPIQRCRLIESVATFDVDVGVFNVMGLAGYEFDLVFDSSAVMFSGA